MLFYNVMEKQGIKYQAVVPEQLICELDPNQIRRVLVHLIRNAVEAMENGGNLEVEVTTDQEISKLRYGTAEWELPLLICKGFRSFIHDQGRRNRRRTGLGRTYRQRSSGKAPYSLPGQRRHRSHRYSAKFLKNRRGTKQKKTSPAKRARFLFTIFPHAGQGNILEGNIHTKNLTM